MARKQIVDCDNPKCKKILEDNEQLLMSECNIIYKAIGKLEKHGVFCLRLGNRIVFFLGGFENEETNFCYFLYAAGVRQHSVWNVHLHCYRSCIQQAYHSEGVRCYGYMDGLLGRR